MFRLRKRDGMLEEMLNLEASVKLCSEGFRGRNLLYSFSYSKWLNILTEHLYVEPRYISDAI